MMLSENFPPLYECSVCGAPVKVVPVEGGEPEKVFKCSHTDAIIWANRKVTLRGEGELNAFHKAKIKITLTVRQFLSLLTGRSV
jgi:hypothetical protein